MTDLVARRMHRQHLWGGPLASLDEVLGVFGAMQAQEFGPAKWGLAQRAAAVTQADVDAAFAAGTLLRTHILRPTWHFVHARDIGWMLRVSAPRVHAVNAYYYRQTGIDADMAAKTRAVFEESLRDGGQCTRAELARALASAGLPLAGVPLAYAIMHAELEGQVISGAMRGRQHTYALLDSRAPDRTTMGRDEALAELTRRYLGGRGPATVKDYGAWASLTAAAARRGLDMLGAEATAEVIGERTYWSLATAPRRPVARPPSPVIDLVQDYDEYLMGYSESRDVVLRPDGPTTSVPGRMRALLLDGTLLGFWRYAVSGAPLRADVTTILDRPMTGAQSVGMDRAVRRFGAFLGVPATWS